ncbi:hypothetical protein IAU60_001708 [Kwoniella sp. DSM 27419]
MKVLILGATGSLGLPAAEAFARSGHIVYGSTRSKASAQSKLAPNEIIPVVVDPHSEEGRKQWGKIAAQCDVVIEALVATGPDDAKACFQNFLDHIDRRAGSPKPTYIYTGGLWVNARGPGGIDEWTDERQPVTDLNEAVRWRHLVENPILESDKVNGIVIRAGMVYGKDASLFGPMLFEPALKAASTEDKIFKTIYNEDSRITSIHEDDAADLYVRVAERGPLLGGQIFLASNPATERLTDIIDAVMRVSGTKGYERQAPSNPFESAYASTCLVKPTLGHALVGWTCKKQSLVDGMDVYWSAWLARRQNNQ